MQMDDMVIISVDDHAVEPPEAFIRHYPEGKKDRAPRIEQDNGKDIWSWNGQRFPTIGLNAVVGRPRSEYGMEPSAFEQLRPGTYDPKLRVDDMNANGVLASLNFPTMAGFSARTFNEGEDKDVAHVMMQAYNDWVIDEWCAAHPERFIPLGMVPNWDPELAAAEVHRIGKKGCRSISFLETPHVYGLPSFMSGHWDPMLKAICDENMVLSLHIGAGFERPVLRHPDAGHAGRARDECRPLALVVLDRLQGLKGLAEPGIIGEKGAAVVEKVVAVPSGATPRPHLHQPRPHGGSGRVNRQRVRQSSDVRLDEPVACQRADLFEQRRLHRSEQQRATRG